ncbi:helix-turn-helix transcriptional regulator, partial [Thermogemmatispora sp.]
SLRVISSPFALWAATLGITFCSWALLALLIILFWKQQGRRLWPLALAIDLALCVAANLLFAPLPSSIAAAAFLLPAYGWAIAYGVGGVLIVLLTFCWSELVLALARLSTNQPPANWLATLLWLLLISLTAALHLLLSRRQPLLVPIFNTQSDALLQPGSPAFQPSESQQADEAGKRERAAPQIISTVTLHCDPNATSLAGGPLHRDALPGVQASLLLTALEVAFAPYGVKLDQHRQQLECALEALTCPHTADPSQFVCCLQQLLQEAEHHWQQRAALSAREWELLRLLAEGLSYRQIGQRLYLSPSTVKTHMRHIQKKLGVVGREELLRLARVRCWINDTACQQRAEE